MKTSFIAILLCFVTSLAYARPNFCPEAELSEEQKLQIKEKKRSSWEKVQQDILETIPQTEEQRMALAECFELKKNTRNHCRKVRQTFSETQHAQITELHEDFGESNQDLGKEERRAARAKLRQDILETVPQTEEQRMALAECFELRTKARNHCKEVKQTFSEEQKASIKEIKRSAWMEIRQDILQTIPQTEQQKEALSNCFEQRKEKGRHTQKN